MGVVCTGLDPVSPKVVGILSSKFGGPNINVSIRRLDHTHTHTHTHKDGFS